MPAKTEIARGQRRTPLACGCSGDSGSGYTLRCAEGQRLWQELQAVGRGVSLQKRARRKEDWPTYERARQAYMAHVAANRVQAVGG